MTTIQLRPQLYHGLEVDMKKCPILLAIKNNRLVSIPDCREECLIKIRGKCLVHMVSECLRQIASALTGGR